MVLRSIGKTRPHFGSVHSIAREIIVAVMPVLLFACAFLASGITLPDYKRDIPIGFCVAASTLALFALLGSVSDWRRAARSISAAGWVGVAAILGSPLLPRYQGTTGAIGNSASSGTFDLSNAIAAVLAVVLAVTTLIATKTATDARDEIRRLMGELNDERERNFRRWALTGQLASLRTALLAKRAELERLDALLVGKVSIESMRARSDGFKAFDTLLSAVELIGSDNDEDENLVNRLGSAQIILEALIISPCRRDIRKALRECGAFQLPNLIIAALDNIPAMRVGNSFSTEKVCALLRNNGRLIKKLNLAD